MPSSNKYRIKAGVIVYDNDSRFLLVKNSIGGKLGFPKGECEIINGKVETLKECAARELKEETSLVIDSSLLNPNNTWYKEHITFYLVHMQDIPRNLKPLDNEIQDVLIANIDHYEESNYNRPLRQFTKALNDNTVKLPLE